MWIWRLLVAVPHSLVVAWCLELRLWLSVRNEIVWRRAWVGGSRLGNRTILLRVKVILRLRITLICGITYSLVGIIAVQVILVALIESIYFLLALLLLSNSELVQLLPRWINLSLASGGLAWVLLVRIINLLLLLLFIVFSLDLMVIYEFKVCHILEILVRETIQVGLLLVVVDVEASCNGGGDGKQASQARSVDSWIHSGLEVQADGEGHRHCETDSGKWANELLIFVLWTFLFVQNAPTVSLQIVMAEQISLSFG